MLTLVLWLLALYGAIIAVWNVLMAVWNQKQTYKTGVHAIVFAENGADYMEGCIDPLLKSATLLKRELKITAIDLQSRDETLAILLKLSKRYDMLHVISSTEQEAKEWLLHTLADTERMVCILDLRKLRDPQEVAAAVSGLCGK